MTLETPIRYGANDPIEAWLYRLLCLDAKVRCRKEKKEKKSASPCLRCRPYWIMRDILFVSSSLLIQCLHYTFPREPVFLSMCCRRT